MCGLAGSTTASRTTPTGTLDLDPDGWTRWTRPDGHTFWGQRHQRRRAGPAARRLTVQLPHVPIARALPHDPGSPPRAAPPARPERTDSRPILMSGSGPQGFGVMRPGRSPLSRGSDTTTGVPAERESARASSPSSISAQRRHGRSRSSPSSACGHAPHAPTGPLRRMTASGWAWRFSHHAGRPSSAAVHRERDGSRAVVDVAEDDAASPAGLPPDRGQVHRTRPAVGVVASTERARLNTR